MSSSLTAKFGRAFPVRAMFSLRRIYSRTVRRWGRRTRQQAIIVMIALGLALTLGVGIPALISQAPENEAPVTNSLITADMTDSAPDFDAP